VDSVVKFKGEELIDESLVHLDVLVTHGINAVCKVAVVFSQLLFESHRGESLVV